MFVTEDVIRDIFYKMYFFLPKVSEDMPSYNIIFDEFWKQYGITDLNAQIKYIDSKNEKFEKIYSEDVTEVDIILDFKDKELESKIKGIEGKKFEIEKSEKNFYADFKRFIIRKTGEKRDSINQYWKKNAKELLFLIKQRNAIKNESIKKEVQKSLSEFNDNALRFINELIQNADDCIYNTDFNIFTMIFDIKKKEIVVSYPEKGFTYADIISLSSINETNKMTDFDKATSTIGEKGRGFKSVFVYFKEVEIESGGYHFKYNIDNLTMFQPIYLGESEQDTGTKLVLHLKDEIILSGDGERKICSDIEALVSDVKKFYGASSPQNLYRNNSIFFTRNFTELRIIFKDKFTFDVIRIVNSHQVEDSTIKNKIWWTNSDNEELHYCTGTMEYISAESIKNELLEMDYIDKLSASYKLNVIGLVKYIDFPKEIIQQRYGEVNEEQIVEIKNNMPIIIFGIRDIELYDDVSYTKDVTDIYRFTGHMYTYLPTSLNIKLPFIFQIPFNLLDNRSCPRSVDERNCVDKWNEYLFKFVCDKKDSIIREWYEYVKKNKKVENIYDYLPTKKLGGKTFEFAFYNEEKYNFDPLGGSKYAACAKEEINKFNKKL